MLKSSLIICLAWLSGLTVMAQEIKNGIADLVPTGTEVYRYGYDKLTAEEKAVYDQCLVDIIGFNTSIKDITYVYAPLSSYPSSTTNVNKVIPMLKRLTRDVPELYIVASEIPRTKESKHAARLYGSYTPETYLTELEAIDESAQTILSQTNSTMTTYEKLLIIHDKLALMCNYGGMSSASAGNIKGAFIDKTVVCEGFSRAFLYLCQRAGIRCMYVTGQLLTKPEEDLWGTHAWNFVEVDNKWYLIDMTADGSFPGIVGHDGFLRGKDYFEQSYRPCYPSTDGDTWIYPNEDGIPELADKDYEASAPNDDTPTRTKDPQACKTTDGTYYNMMGQRLTKPQKGLNIKDGKIVMIR